MLHSEEHDGSRRVSNNATAEKVQLLKIAIRAASRKRFIGLSSTLSVAIFIVLDKNDLIDIEERNERKRMQRVKRPFCLSSCLMR